MKKTALLFALLFCFLLSACGQTDTNEPINENDAASSDSDTAEREDEDNKTDDDDQDNDDISPEAPTDAENTDAQTPVEPGDDTVNSEDEPTAAPADDSDISDNPAPEEPSGSSNDMTFEGQVVIDNDNCKIEITKIEVDDIWGYTLKANLENKSADKTYMFTVASAAINGVACDPFFASEVNATKKAIEDISFMTTALDEVDIGEYTDLQITFRVYDSDDWSADDVALETVHIYPYGEENATVFVREPQESDIILCDNDYVTAIVTGIEEDSIWGYTLNLFLVNKTDATVMFTVDDASVNGYMADPYFATSVIPGMCAFSEISWMDTTLKDIGITDMAEIEELEFSIRAYNSDDWYADDFVNEVIILNP